MPPRSSAATPKRASSAILPPEETPDGRPGVSLLLFAFSRDALQKAVINRVGQCILTCPTTACYNGLPIVKDKSIRIGGNLRFFGDGFQFSKKLEGRRFWRLPVMDGEFVCEDVFGTIKGVAGGNFLILGESQDAALAAAEAAIAAIRQVPGVILPFPGGVVRCGSKVGSRYKKLRASTNDAYCPDPARPGRSPPCRKASTPSMKSSSTASIWPAVEQATRVGVRGGVPSRRRPHHAPATTAANSGRFTCICTNYSPAGLRRPLSFAQVPADQSETSARAAFANASGWLANRRGEPTMPSPRLIARRPAHPGRADPAVVATLSC